MTDIVLWLNQTETKRTTEPIRQLDRLPATTLAEQVVRSLHKTMARYVAAHPHHLSRFASRAIVDLYRALDRHNLAELSTRLAIAVGEIEQQESVAMDPVVRQALDEAGRFLKYGVTAGKEQ